MANEGGIKMTSIGGKVERTKLNGTIFIYNNV